jgi:hypothetical protein
MQSPGIIASNVLDQFLPSISTTTSDHFQSTEHLGSVEWLLEACIPIVWLLKKLNVNPEKGYALFY